MLCKCVNNSRLLLLVGYLFTHLLFIRGQNTILMDSVVHAGKSGIENILQGTIAGVRVKSWTGTPGFQSLISLRGIRIPGYEFSSEPLILINGIPLISTPSSVSLINPLSYYPAEQIERVEIIKDAVRLSGYGVLAPNGAINIITKGGRQSSIHVAVSAFTGFNFLNNFDRKKNLYYGFNPQGRSKVYGTTLIHEENFIIDGGGSFGSYLLGFNNQRDGGSIKGLLFQQQSIYFKAKYNITDKFSTEFYNNFSLTSRDDRYAGMLHRFLKEPDVGDETFFMDKNKNTGLLAGLKLNYRFTPQFAAFSTFGISYEGSKRDLYIPSDLCEKNVRAMSVAYKRQYVTMDNYLQYVKEIAEKPALRVTLGNTVIVTENRLVHVDGKKSIDAGGSDYVKLVRGYNAGQTDAFSDLLSEKLLSFYMLGEIKLSEDATIDMSLRADGSSLYKNKWSFYPAIGATFDFAKFNLPFLANISLGRIGMVSRPEIYRGELVGTGKYYNDTQLGITQLYHPFGQAQSASIIQMDGGLTFRLSRDICLALQYFNKRYGGMTYRRFLPNSYGTDFQYENRGFGLGLNGLDLSLTGTLLHTRSLRWFTNINMAYHKNSILDLPGNVGKTSLSEYAPLKRGDRITSLIVCKGESKEIVGDSEHSFFGGFVNELRFRNVALSAKIVFGMGAVAVAESPVDRDPLTNRDNLSGYYLLREEEGGEIFYHAVSSVENADFVRLSNIHLSYDLNSLLKRKRVRNDLLLFVEVDNLYTLSKYSGYNPEENMQGVKEYDLSTTGTPLPATIALGVRLNFK